MGFYSPATIIKDAQQHGLRVRSVDVMRSNWNCTLEKEGEQFVLRLGLRYIRGLRQAAAERIVVCRAQRPFTSIFDLTKRVTELTKSDLQMLATLGALNAIGIDTGVKLHPRRAVAGSEIWLACSASA
jgi:error-prone DNA polymerase